MMKTFKKANNDVTTTTDTTTTDTATTVLGKGIRIEAALLSGEGTIEIEGEYDGEINIDGKLILAKSGRINGNIKTKTAYISGNIEGNITCTELLHIKPTGRIIGDIESASTLMDEGAIFVGYSKMSSSTSNTPPRFDAPPRFDEDEDEDE